MTNFLKNNLVYYATYKCRFECVFFFFFPFIGNMLHDHYKERKSGVHDLSRIKALLLLMSFAYFSAYFIYAISF